MPSAVRIERVAAMHADLGLDLGVGSHAGQGTRDGSKSVLIFRSTANNRRLAKHLRQRINYFLKLTQPSSILAIATGRNDRAVISMSAPYSEIAWSA